MARTKKVEATPVVEVKEVKAEPKAEVKKEAAKKEAKKAPAKKTATKKAAAPKKEVKNETVITLQFYGNDVTVAAVEEKVKAAFVAEGHKAGAIKTLNIYLKPEESAAYYVINDKHAGRVDLF